MIIIYVIESIEMDL